MCHTRRNLSSRVTRILINLPASRKPTRRVVRPSKNEIATSHNNSRGSLRQPKIAQTGVRNSGNTDYSHPIPPPTRVANIEDTGHLSRPLRRILDTTRKFYRSEWGTLDNEIRFSLIRGADYQEITNQGVTVGLTITGQALFRTELPADSICGRAFLVANLKDNTIVLSIKRQGSHEGRGQVTVYASQTSIAPDYVQYNGATRRLFDEDTLNSRNNRELQTNQNHYPINRTI